MCLSYSTVALDSLLYMTLKNLLDRNSIKPNLIKFLERLGEIKEVLIFAEQKRLFLSFCHSVTLLPACVF